MIRPAEELCWRRLVRHRSINHGGKPAGVALGTAAYGGAHLVTGNLTLIGGATIAGGYWGALSAMGLSTGALIVSHVARDITIFLIVPTVSE